MRWLVGEGVAKADQVFVTGASYGGFLSLLSVGRRPDLFAGATALVNMADWAVGAEDMSPAQRAAWKAFFRAATSPSTGTAVATRPAAAASN